MLLPLLLTLSSIHALTVTKVSSLALKDAAMITLADFDCDGSVDLLISSFTGSPLGSGSFHVVRNVSLENLSTQKADLIVDGLVWPNEILGVPTSYEKFFGHGAFIPDGFLVSGKNTGAIRFVSSEGKLSTITKDKAGFFYHRVVLVDVNEDGLPDVLTARATKPMVGNGYGEFLWLENPGGNNPLNEIWTEHVLAQKTTPGGFESPDIYFTMDDIDGDGVQEIPSALFFNGAVELLTLGAKGVSVSGMVLDRSLSSMFDIRALDLNGDGKKELLATNHVNDPSLSGVYAYEYKSSSNIRDAASWQRHDLFKGFVVTEPGIGQAAPGGVWPLYYGNSKKPALVVSGDGAQEVFLLTAQSEDAGDWSYAMQIVDNYKATVGDCVVSGSDGFFCTDYDHGVIYAYRVSA